jgi:hypothetical protein
MPLRSQPMLTHRITDREPKEGKSFSLVIGGDVCPRQRGEERILAGETGAIFQKIQPFLDAADLRVVQWETPLTTHPNPLPKCGILHCHPKTAALAASAGFDLALLANNHTGDHGPDVVFETIRHLNAAGVRTVGAGKLAEARAPACFELPGPEGRTRRLAFLNFAENEFGMAREDRAGASPLSPLANIAAVRAAKRHADFVIVALHGGHERNPFPSPRMRELFQALAEAGAAVVFNCHPHCPQGVEFHQGTPIVYSPGNLYFPSLNGGPNKVWWTGYLPKFHFDPEGCHTVELLPYTFTPEEVQPLSEADFSGFVTYFQRLCLPLTDKERMQALFESWSSVSAQHYLSHGLAGIPSDWLLRLDDPQVIRGLLALRNQFTCESHAEMTRCYFQLLEQGRLAGAHAGYPELLAFQNPSWVDVPGSTP